MKVRLLTIDLVGPVTQPRARIALETAPPAPRDDISLIVPLAEAQNLRVGEHYDLNLRWIDPEEIRID